MERRLQQEDFETLDLHRVIANADSRILIDHSTAIISARGDGYMQGVVLDPWRKGGVLHWVQTAQDDKYDWAPQQEVLRQKRERRMRRNGQSAQPV